MHLHTTSSDNHNISLYQVTAISHH